jgi:5-methylcytosine-specific restriction endonuclease McrA
VGVLAVLGALAVVVPILISSRRRRLVTESSAALAELRGLNGSYEQRLTYSGRIIYTWEDRVNSKAKLDRYNLKQFFLERLLVLEEEIDRRIAVQVRDAAVYAEYRGACQELGSRLLGGSESDKLKTQTFARVEQKLFTKKLLKEPVCAAQVRCTARYTSPKGQNAYAKSYEWDFEQLRNGLAEMRRIRETQSTAKFLRQQERNRMNASIRYQVLTRDDSRCQRCGATPQTDGVILHVDHIIPVSKGGRTELDNLQTLCERCNLGKSDRS